MTKIVLASTSIYRRQLLEKLNLPFVCDAPNIDETAMPNEKADRLVQRLSIEKAAALATKYPNSLIIGSDQACLINHKLAGKPLTFDNAFDQLKAASGNKVTFYTGLSLLNSQTQYIQTVCEICHVYFRKLTNEEITHYIHRERPLDCAGSFKSEGLGITLFDKFEGDDPNSLIGLPLIKLTKMLINQDVNPLFP